MKNEVITLSSDKYKTLGIADERLFLSEKKEQKFSALQKTAQDVSDTSKGKAILLEKINKPCCHSRCNKKAMLVRSF